jgi:lysophospholipase L1-like esterase
LGGDVDTTPDTDSDPPPADGAVTPADNAVPPTDDAVPPTDDAAPPTDNSPSGDVDVPPLGALVRICPMGDSITAGNGEHATYRRPLWKSLQALHANVDFVGSMHDNNTGPPPYSDYDWDNEGHGGYTAEQLAARLPDWMLTYEPPDIVLLHIGTNDINQGDTTSVILDDITSILGAIRARNPRAIILLAQIIGMTSSSFTDKARDLNAAIPAFAAAHSTAQSPIRVVDQMTTFNPGTMTFDGTHPNDTGEAEMASVWLAALRPLLGL